jgi:hypothetical protein
MPDEVTDRAMAGEGIVKGPLGIHRKAYRPKKVADPKAEPLFQRIADKVSYGMGTPANIAVWVVLVVGWTLLFATKLVPASGSFLPTWFTSTGYNFPLNLVTTVAELYIGFLVGAASNRSERNLEDTLGQIQTLENKLATLIQENTELTNQIKTDTDLLQDLHTHVAALTKAAGLLIPDPIRPPTS